MEHPAEPTLPTPLPRPLSDPLRRYRWFLLFAVPLLWLAVVLGWLLPDVRKVRQAAARTQTQNNLKQMAAAIQEAQHRGEAAAGIPINGDGNAAGDGETRHRADAATGTPSQNNLRQTRTPRDTAESAALAALLTVLLCTLLLLPRRATNALYLRSFRNDAATGSLRTVAQAALGPPFRLSGIRDPRRRWPALIRHLLYILFLIRYAQPKFMNLEAGLDWKARLWRSLGEARCALIDVSELTSFVREEVELATRCLGFHRVLFVGNDSRTADEWRQAVLAALGSPDVPPERLQVALWADTAAGRAAFRDQVRAFADRLPADPPGPNASAYPETASSSDPGGNAVTGESWRTFLIATLIGAAISGALLWAQICTPDAGLLWYLPVAIYYTLAFLLLLQYFLVCGSPRQRLRLGGTFLFAAVFSSLPLARDLVAPVEGARNAVAHGESIHNLEQIGLALDRYERDRGHPPPLAVCQPDGTPLLSWRVLLLPYLGEREKFLFGHFRLDEPWDSPHNLELLGDIPPLYRLPYTLPKTEPADTCYQALTGPGTLWGEYTPAGRRPQPYFPRGQRQWLLRQWQLPTDVPGSTGLAAFEPLFRLEDVRESGHPVILVVEAAEAVPWTKPADLDYRPAAQEWVRKLGPTRFGFSVLLANGNVRSFDGERSLKPEEWEALAAVRGPTLDESIERFEGVGSAYDRAVVDLGATKKLVLPDNAIVRRTGEAGKVQLFMKKTMVFWQHPPVSIREARKNMGCAVRAEEGTLVVATFGEWNSTVEGSASMHLVAVVPEGVELEQRKGLSGPDSTGLEWRWPHPTRPRDGWTAVPAVPDPDRTTK